MGAVGGGGEGEREGEGEANNYNVVMSEGETAVFARKTSQDLLMMLFKKVHQRVDISTERYLLSTLYHIQRGQPMPRNSDNFTITWTVSGFLFIRENSSTVEPPIGEYCELQFH